MSAHQYQHDEDFQEAAEVPPEPAAEPPVDVVAAINGAKTPRALDEVLIAAGMVDPDGYPLTLE